jgi:hypothetical protein
MDTVAGIGRPLLGSPGSVLTDAFVSVIIATDSVANVLIASVLVTLTFMSMTVFE